MHEALTCRIRQSTKPMSRLHGLWLCSHLCGIGFYEVHPNLSRSHDRQSKLSHSASWIQAGVLHPLRF